MLSVCACKIVRSAKVFLGTHVQIAVMHAVKYCIDAHYAGDTDGARRKPLVLVRIVRTLHFKKTVVYAACTEVAKRKLHGRVGLQIKNFIF